MPLLEVTNLRTSFHTRHGIVRAVNDVSFALEKGDTLGIVGESGSGKSVTCYSLMRLIPQPPGKIEGGTGDHPAGQHPVFRPLDINFDEYALAAGAIKLAVKDLFPGAEVEFARGDRDYYLAAHDLSLHMCVGVIFAGAIVLILRNRFVRRQCL